MNCRDYSVTQVLVGLHKIGIVGLADAVRAAEAADLDDRETIVDLMLDALAASNYIPDRQAEPYRVALWREYLRHRGGPYSAFFSRAPVTVRGGPGSERDRFVELVRSVFAKLELKPVIAFESECAEGPWPQLEIHGEIVARGAHSPQTLETAVRRSLSDW